MNTSRISETLKNYIGYKIGIYTIDGNNIEGTLIDIKSDFFVIKNENEEVSYFNTNTIQAFMKNTKEFKIMDKLENPIEETNLLTLIGKHIYDWVTVKCSNQLVFSGILSQTADDHIILTIKEKQLFIQANHIVDFFPGTPLSNNQLGEQGKEKDKSLDNETNAKKSEDSEGKHNTTAQTQSEEEEGNPKDTVKEQKGRDKKQKFINETNDQQYSSMDDKKDKQNSCETTSSGNSKKPKTEDKSLEKDMMPKNEEHETEENTNENQNKRQELKNTIKRIIEENINNLQPSEEDSKKTKNSHESNASNSTKHIKTKVHYLPIFEKDVSNTKRKTRKTSPWITKKEVKNTGYFGLSYRKTNKVKKKK